MYELIQSSTVDPSRNDIIQNLQERSIWLVCIDDAIDRRTIRALYKKGTDIIGFTTGEGSFGQMNLAITGKPELKNDMLKRCRRRLSIMFHGLDDEKLQTAAETCVEKAGKLDGVSLLRAMNPHDYYINNYMSMRMIMVKLRMGRSLSANALILSGCLLAAHLQIKMLKM